MADDERANAERLLVIYRRNLQRALEKKAGFGALNVPTWLENEIAEARTQIAFYEPLAPPQKQSDTAERVSGSIDLTTLYIQGTQIAAEQARQADQNKEIIEQQVRDQLWRIQAKEVIDELVQHVGKEQEIRVQRQEEHDERMTGMERLIEDNVFLLLRRINWVRGLAVAVLIIVIGLAGRVLGLW